MDIQQKIDSLSIQDVDETLHSEDLFASLFYTLEPVKQQKQLHDQLITENNRNAEINLSRAEEINQLKERILLLQKQNQDHRQKLDFLLQQQQQELERFSSKNVTQKLRELVQESDEMTEQICVMFLENKLSEQEFLKAFRESRIVYHSRNSKLEKLTCEA
jgi:hypothetical protein